MKYTPHKYQERAIRFVEERPYCALFLDMGLGKTVTTLTAIANLFEEMSISRVLVVAPKVVAESTWAQECRKWDHLSDLRVSVVMGSAAKRAKALAADADIYVTSRDLFVWVTEQGKWKFDVVVLDELTSFKTSNSKRFKAFKSVRPYMQRVIGLTGTPAPNGLKDLWAQMYCIDMGQRLGRAKTRFMNENFDLFVRNNITIKATLKPGKEKEIYRKIGDIVLTMKAEDYLDVPPIIEIEQRVVLSDDVMKRYRAFERDCVMEFDALTDGASGSVIASSAAALTNKLLQFASGALYIGQESDKSRVWAHTHSEKLDALIELLEQAQAGGESVLVFYQFQHDYERAICHPGLKPFRYRKYSGNADFEAWNAGEVDVLFTHAASTAYGLNLQQGGHVIIWYGTGWNAELYLQGNARLARQGQTHPTRVYKLICEGTADEDAAAAVSGKIATQEAMLQALKKRQKEYNT